MAQASKVAAAAASASKKKRVPEVSSSDSDDDDELDADNGSAHESDSQMVTDHSHKLKRSTSKKSEVITQRHICHALDFSIFIGTPAYTNAVLCRGSLLSRWMLLKVRGNGLITRATVLPRKDISCPG